MRIQQVHRLYFHSYPFVIISQGKAYHKTNFFFLTTNGWEYCETKFVESDTILSESMYCSFLKKSFERSLEWENRLLSWHKWDSLSVFQCDVLKSRKLKSRKLGGRKEDNWLDSWKMNVVYGRIRQLYRRPLQKREENVLFK